MQHQVCRDLTGCTFLRRGKGFLHRSYWGFKLDLKRQKDKTRLGSDKLQDDMPNFKSVTVRSFSLFHKVLGTTNLKCFYMNAHSMRNKQEEVEALAQSQQHHWHK